MLLLACVLPNPKRVGFGKNEAWGKHDRVARIRGSLYGMHFLVRRDSSWRDVRVPMTLLEGLGGGL